MALLDFIVGQAGVKLLICLLGNKMEISSHPALLQPKLNIVNIFVDMYAPYQCIITLVIMY